MGFQGSCSVLDLLNVGYGREIYLYTRHLGVWACRSGGGGVLAVTSHGQQ